MTNTYTKKQLTRLVRAGTWIRVIWDDGPPTTELVIENPNWRDRGDVEIETFVPNEQRDPCAGVVHSQIVAVLGQLVAPN